MKPLSGPTFFGACLFVLGYGAAAMGATSAPPTNPAKRARPAPKAEAPSAKPETVASEPAPLTPAQMEALSKQILAARSQQEAAAANEKLWSQGPASLPYFERLIDNPAIHPEVRFYAITMALGVHDPAVLALAARFIRDPDMDFRKKAVPALLRPSNPKVAVSLMDAILAETDEDLRTNELEALGFTGEPKAIPFIAGYLKPTESALILTGAAAGLAHLGAKEQAPLILSLIKDDAAEWMVNDMFDSANELLGDPGLTLEVAVQRSGDREGRLDVRVREEHVTPRSHAPREVGDGTADVAATDVDAAGEPGLGDGLEQQRAGAGTARRDADLAHEPGVQQRLERQRHGRLGEAGTAGDVGSGDRSCVADRLEHRSLVQLPEQRRRGGGSRHSAIL